MANVLERLTEGTVFQDKKKESVALVQKWENSGLLEGISDEYQRGTMAVLLENQAKELLREANTMASGDVQGFAAVAFPIVRRVFAGLIANDLVSVQPMSLPSGLVFFMDFKYGNDLGPAGDKVITAGDSLYGDRLGVEITGGVRVDGNEHAEKGFFALTSGYGNARVSAQVAASALKVHGVGAIDCGVLSGSDNAKLVRFDPDLTQEAAGKFVTVFRANLGTLQAGATYGALWKLIPEQDLTSLTVISGTVSGAPDSSVPNAQTVTAHTTPGLASLGVSGSLVRRLTRIVQGEGSTTGGGTDDSGVKYLEVVILSTTTPSGALASSPSTKALDYALGAGATLAVGFPIKDQVSNVGDSAIGALKGASPFMLESSGSLPEIQLKVDSFAITARSRKLKASWTPELGQDLNAYHNLDAEVELTSILSEQIGLEIDQEILNDLIKGQTGGVKYWSRRPGKFVNRNTGADLGAALGVTAPPDFTGNVSMWYETLIETINDVSANIHRKTLRGGANFVVCSPEVANILEFTAGFRATVTHDSEKGSIGAVKVGALNSKFDVIVDPYFPRNVMLVGRKGGSFLESGYVYSPYVPLQTSPTIFDPDNFTPRKAVMTRYGKAMVRPDMYGLVIVQDLLG